MPRRTFFSFHYKADVWRAWNVRNCWVVKPDEEISQGFFDNSVFEKAANKSDDALKAFLRDGLDNTSVTCVLAGQETWMRRWVRYEIARSIVRRNGLLTVYIHGVKNKDGETSIRTFDPLYQMALYKSGANIYLAEWNGTKWIKYEDYSLAIPESALWFAAPKNDTPVQIGNHCMSYDFTAQDGRKNIGGWIETAAGLAGR